MGPLIIGLKFCGGCNPLVDRGALVQTIERLLPPEWRLETELESEPWERALLVCGCPIACADRPGTRDLAGQWIRIAGPMVDFDTVPEEELAQRVIQKLTGC
jgi:hypothetical protein